MARRMAEVGSKPSYSRGTSLRDLLNKTPYASKALNLIVQDWKTLSLGDNPETSCEPSLVDITELIERVTALLLVRVVAVAAPLGTYPDLSVTHICRDVLVKEKEWPEGISDGVVRQLRKYVSAILRGYKPPADVPYHNYHHAYHVVLSSCKLLDMMLLKKSSKTYGLRHDPLMLLAQVFAAMIHDVEHQGISNRQLALEKDRLAVLYNDQSIAENWSIYIAFSELLQDEFQELRSAMFETEDEYLRFRKAVVNLVLTTDIASPERTQISKSKYKEAFGDPFETVERKVRAEIRRMSLTGQDVQFHRRLQRRGTGESESALSELPVGDDMPLEQQQQQQQQQQQYAHENNNNNNKSSDSAVGDNDSYSMTPENSEDDETNDVISTPSGHDQEGKIMSSPSDNKLEYEWEEDGGGGGNNKMVTTATTPISTPRGAYSRKSSLGSAQNSYTNSPSKWECSNRRLSSSSSRNNANASMSSSKYRYRLGILRTVDLTGETLETYSRAGSIGHSSAISSVDHCLYSIDLEMDEPDELKMTVVMETIMTAADVAHNLQGWEQMIKWANCLYMELRKAYKAGRGIDASVKWFENQIGFLESYLLPLAHRLDDVGVFGEEMGGEFARIVEDNRDRWLTEGYDETQKIIQEGARVYPIEDED